LPPAVLEGARLRIGDAIDVIARGAEVVIRRRRGRVALDDLLANFDPAKHRHDLLLDDPPIGRESH
jgi:antitoxin component of MazEF toxin-antitoxin module